MSDLRPNRTTTALVLAALLAFVPASLSAGERATLRGERQHTLTLAQGEGLLAQAWHWLVNAWAGQGGLIDPNGTTTTTSSPPLPPLPPPLISPSQGGLIDPNGIPLP